MNSSPVNSVFSLIVESITTPAPSQLRVPFNSSQVQISAMTRGLVPTVGGFAGDTTGRFFPPPQQHKQSKLAEAGQFPVLKNCQLHTGSKDWQNEVFNGV